MLIPHFPASEGDRCGSARFPFVESALFTVSSIKLINSLIVFIFQGVAVQAWIKSIPSRSSKFVTALSRFLAISIRLRSIKNLRIRQSDHKSDHCTFLNYHHSWPIRLRSWSSVEVGLGIVHKGLHTAGGQS